MFLPVRGDGLKLSLKEISDAAAVSPRKGRWIEINVHTLLI